MMNCIYSLEKDYREVKSPFTFYIRPWKPNSQLRANCGFAIKVFPYLTLDWQARKSRWIFFPQSYLRWCHPEKIWGSSCWIRSIWVTLEKCFRVWGTQLSNVQATLVDLSVIDQEQYKKELGTKDKRPEAISCIVYGLLNKAEKVSYIHQATAPTVLSFLV